MSLGVLLFLFGILSKIQHWPNNYNAEMLALIFALTGAIIFVISLIRKRNE